MIVQKLAWIFCVEGVASNLLEEFVFVPRTGGVNAVVVAAPISISRFDPTRVCVSMPKAAAILG